MTLIIWRLRMEESAMKAGKTRPLRPLTPEERRLALIRTQRETARVVKRTLVGIALFAFGYYLCLLSRSRRGGDE
ncbi:MAG: hypothetical protein KIG81_02880 [Thermoguttaceae bacterium]|nr:hypothetical protein [Thermoguttaceae bacterium]